MIERPAASCSNADSRVSDQRPRVFVSRRVPAGSNPGSPAGKWLSPCHTTGPPAAVCVHARHGFAVPPVEAVCFLARQSGEKVHVSYDDLLLRIDLDCSWISGKESG